MGWLFCAESRRVLIASRIRREEDDNAIRETIRHCLKGNVLWGVRQITVKATGEVYRIITCDLLRRYGSKEAGYPWGYKDLTEADGPLYYHCPLSYLELAYTDVNEDWRKNVRRYHGK